MDVVRMGFVAPNRSIIPSVWLALIAFATALMQLLARMLAKMSTGKFPNCVRRLTRVNGFVVLGLAST